MSLITKLTPTNFLEEKEKFISDFTYNPQFVYEEPVDDTQLIKYGLPQPKYLQIAQEILDRTYFGRNEADLLMMEGKLQTQEEVDKRIHTFLKMHDLEARYQVIWSSSFVSRATITSDTIKLRTNSEFREEGLIGMIYHEIGTHALRRINYEHQPWFKKKKAFGLHTDYLRTEEGLSTLHALLPKSFKSAYTAAIRYVAVDYAQTHSLAETWDFVGKYVQDLETRWMITFRQKRGVTDTNLGGGFTKDIVYFEGMIQVWQWLVENDFNVSKLYLGKIAIEDIEIAAHLASNKKPVLPSFYVLNPDEYQKIIMEIGQANYLNIV